MFSIIIACGDIIRHFTEIKTTFQRADNLGKDEIQAPHVNESFLVKMGVEW